MHSSHAALFQILVFGVKLQTLVVGLECLVVLLHKVMAGGLAQVSLRERRVDLQTLLGVLQGRRELQQLDVGHRSVCVYRLTVGVASQTLSVLLDGTGEVSIFEELVAFLSELLGLDRVDELLGLIVLLLLLSLLKLVLHARVVALKERCLVKLDGFVVEAEGHLRVRLASQRLP